MVRFLVRDVNVGIDMRLVAQLAGRSARILALELDNGDVPALAFLEAVKRNDVKAHRILMRGIANRAERGRSRNQTQYRMIEGDGMEGLYEFKTWVGHRLMCFDRPNRVILLNGFSKGDPAQREYERAARYRDAILDMEGKHGYD